ncbi:MAG: hypothetical protein ACI4PR_03635 [Acutalibacteraceae bacterium]
MEKKKMTNKKKFWIGMSSLAAIGAITATVAYFSSVHVFNPDTLKSLGYSVSATKLLDSAAIQDMSSDRKVNADVMVKNEGNGPILARITYYWQSTLTDEAAAIELDNNDLTDKGWTFNANSSFLKGSDKSYYYKGIIGEGLEVQHLDEISYSGSKNYGGDTKYTTNNGSTWVDEVVGTVNGEKKTYYFGESKTGYLTVVVETVQATDASGAALTVPESATAETLRGYWTNLGKSTPATPGGM